MLHGQLSTRKIVAGDRWIAMTGQRHTPDDKRGLHLEQRLYVRILSSGGHQDEAVGAAGVEVVR